MAPWSGRGARVPKPMRTGGKPIVRAQDRVGSKRSAEVSIELPLYAAAWTYGLAEGNGAHTKAGSACNRHDIWCVY